MANTVGARIRKLLAELGLVDPWFTVKELDEYETYVKCIVALWEHDVKVSFRKYILETQSSMEKEDDPKLQISAAFWACSAEFDPKERITVSLAKLYQAAAVQEKADALDHRVSATIAQVQMEWNHYRTFCLTKARPDILDYNCTHSDRLQGELDKISWEQLWDNRVWNEIPSRTRALELGFTILGKPDVDIKFTPQSQDQSKQFALRLRPTVTSAVVNLIHYLAVQAMCRVSIEHQYTRIKLLHEPLGRITESDRVSMQTFHRTCYFLKEDSISTVFDPATMLQGTNQEDDLDLPNVYIDRLDQLIELLKISPAAHVMETALEPRERKVVLELQTELNLPQRSKSQNEANDVSIPVQNLSTVFEGMIVMYYYLVTGHQATVLKAIENVTFNYTAAEFLASPNEKDILEKIGNEFGAAVKRYRETGEDLVQWVKTWDSNNGGKGLTSAKRWQLTEQIRLMFQYDCASTICECFDRFEAPNESKYNTPESRNAELIRMLTEFRRRLREILPGTFYAFSRYRRELWNSAVDVKLSHSRETRHVALFPIVSNQLEFMTRSYPKFLDEFDGIKLRLAWYVSATIDLTTAVEKHIDAATQLRSNTQKQFQMMHDHIFVQSAIPVPPWEQKDAQPHLLVLQETALVALPKSYDLRRWLQMEQRSLTLDASVKPLATSLAKPSDIRPQRRYLLGEPTEPGKERETKTARQDLKSGAVPDLPDTKQTLNDYKDVLRNQLIDVCASLLPSFALEKIPLTVSAGRISMLVQLWYDNLMKSALIAKVKKTETDIQTELQKGEEEDGGENDDELNADGEFRM